MFYSSATAKSAASTASTPTEPSHRLGMRAVMGRQTQTFIAKARKALSISHSQRLVLAGLLLAGLLISQGLAYVPALNPLSESADLLLAWKTLLFVTFTVALWISRILPSWQSNLLVLAWLLLASVANFTDLLSAALHPTTAFVGGALVLGAALKVVGLQPWLQAHVLSWSKGSAIRLAAFFFWGSLLSSFLIQEHIIVALLFPVVLGLRDSLRHHKHTAQPGIESLWLASVAWGGVIGGLGTYLGGGRALLANALLQKASGGALSFTFWQWAFFCVPLALLMGLLTFPFLLGWYGALSASQPPLLDQLPKKTVQKLNHKQRGVLITLVLVVAGWMFTSDWLNPALLAALGFIGLLATGAVAGKSLFRATPWNIIIAYATAILLGELLVSSGATDLVYSTLEPWLSSQGDVALLASATFGAGALTELMSNAATVGATLPVALELGLPKPLVTLAIALSAGLALILPMGTPAMALLLSADGVRTRDFLIPALLLKVLLTGLIVLYLGLFWKVGGLW